MRGCYSFKHLVNTGSDRASMGHLGWTHRINTPNGTPRGEGGIS
ncbi:MAG: hypothetical protein QOC85_267, partial [Streptomyces sp.]|nr:hypothetical protein [Streptomyces sp.]